jgi:hypothetical protein
MSQKATRSAALAIFQQFAGQSATLVIPRPFIELCQGDHLAALLLSQLLYWSERTNDEDGWFAKSYEDWYKEIGLTEYQIKRTIKGDKRRKNAGFSLTSIGAETKLKRSDFYGGAATLHYRINQDVLQDAIWSFIRDQNIVQNGIKTLSGSTPQQCSERSYTEIITKNTMDAPDGAEEKPPKPKKQRDAVYDMVAEVWFEVKRDTPAFAALGGRIGHHVAWLKGNDRTVKRDGQQVTIPGCRMTITREMLEQAKAAYKRQNRGASLPLELTKFVAFIDSWLEKQVRPVVTNISAVSADHDAAEFLLGRKSNEH